PRRKLDHSQSQSGSRIEHGAVDAVLVLKTNPGLGVRIFALALAREAALPAVGIEYRPRGVPVHFTEIALDMSEQVLVLLHHVSVCIDNESRHFVCLLMVWLTSSMNNSARHLSSFPRRRESRPFVFLDSGSPPAKSGLAGMTVGNMQ